ncbi:unnamed protein product [Gulo gulo]|uniref:Uncharacterized protein n=1 Tax=Gulo gulo TaxID=48420 RepID=A0A9X9LI21_GULGU|nr:unnamed protein product [Gulo gulo]
MPGHGGSDGGFSEAWPAHHVTDRCLPLCCRAWACPWGSLGRGGPVPSTPGTGPPRWAAYEEPGSFPPSVYPRTTSASHTPWCRSNRTSSRWAASSTASRVLVWTRSPRACSPSTSSRGRCS